MLLFFRISLSALLLRMIDAVGIDQRNTLEGSRKQQDLLTEHSKVKTVHGDHIHYVLQSPTASVKLSILYFSSCKMVK